MQCFILFIGAMPFVFYQFEPPPVFFNRPAYEAAAAGGNVKLAGLQDAYRAAVAEKQTDVRRLLGTLAGDDPAAVQAE